MGAVLSLSGLSILSILITLSISRLSSSQPLEGPEVHFAKVSNAFRVRKQDGSEEEEQELSQIVSARCGSVFKPFIPPWWLANGHFQTLYSVLGDFSKTDRMWYNRTYLRLRDGGTLGLDFAPVDASKLADDVPIIVIQHGLTGGSYEAYIRAVLVPACTPVESGGLGYRAVVVNYRGCAGVPITSQQLYSAGATDDYRQAIMYIASLFPKAPLLGLGFSLGANVMTRYIAEDGRQSRLNSGCALGCPWDLEDNNTRLLNSFLGRHVYSKGMGGNLLALVKRNIVPLTADPEHRTAKAVPFAMSLKNPTLRDFDHAFTRWAGGAPPIFPFESAEKYYEWASSHYVVKDITVPFLAINAADDPVVRYAPMDGAGNGLVVMVRTAGGGHLGWFQDDGTRLGRWTTKPVLEWLQLVGRDLVQDDNSTKPRPLYVDEEGFLTEVGREQLGCKVIDGGGLIDGNGGEAGTLQGL
ncbi:Alpha/Beta hydrolase protein [Mycena floridula]|nr:Alpha/Beta hydrolase protein [Mycena floridula]